MESQEKWSFVVGGRSDSYFLDPVEGAAGFRRKPTLCRFRMVIEAFRLFFSRRCDFSHYYDEAVEGSIACLIRPAIYAVCLSSKRFCRVACGFNVDQLNYKAD